MQPPPPPRAAVAAAVAASSATPAQAGGSSSAALVGAAAGAAGTSPVGPGAGSSARRRTTGMVVYQASEKDCVGENGGPQECVICFEEFEPGVGMGRLECLCKFHKVSVELCLRYSSCGLGVHVWTIEVSVSVSTYASAPHFSSFFLPFGN